MGQTLTHGIYLPDEGERNCYNGLAANWQLLDGAVGTIAEHTAALSDKAPLVHTHTKSDITDFPALANVATSGSYNDLSNIPASFTPASHTHGNLTNDGKVGTTANKPLITGTDGIVQAGSFGNAANTFCEGNDSRLSDARTPVAHTHGKADITDLFNSANTWSGTNSFTAANININSSNFSLGDTVSSNQVKRFQWYDASSNRYACIAVNYATDKSVWVDIPLRTKNTEGTSFVDKGIRFQVKPDNTSAFLPVTNSVTDLGTSTNKWKTLNGINPGALSLPTTDSTKWVDLSGSMSAPPVKYTYTPVVDGWISVLAKRSGGDTAVFLIQGNISNACYNKDSSLVGETATFVSACIPVRAGVDVDIHIKGSGTTIESAYFIPCQGNV